MTSPPFGIPWRPSVRLQRRAILAVLGAGLALRLFRLSHFSLWLDEILEAFWVRGSWPSFWSSLRFDGVHPPLDYLIARFVDHLNPSDPARKAPDVLFGLASLAACYELLRLRAGRPLALAATSLLVLAPFHVRYSQEFRPHILGLCLVVTSLLLLERYLRRPTAKGLALLFVAAVATEYALYLGALALGVAGLALLGEDALGGATPQRRALARRCLLFLPLFVLLLWVAYLPWWPVVRDVAHRVSPVGREPLTWARLMGEWSFFTVGAFEGDPLRGTGVLYGVLAVIGAAVAFRRPGVRFVPFWLVCGFAAIEVLGRIHPHPYAPRRLLCVAPPLAILAAVCLVSLWRSGRTARVLAAGMTLAVFLGLAGGLQRYFSQGRRDWRPLAAFLARTPGSEEIFTENQWTQLCLAYYIDGPDWLWRQLAKPPRPAGRPVSNLDGEVVRLTWSWKPGTPAWVVLGGAPEHAALREWSARFQGRDFPEAEGKARLILLAPDRREKAFSP